jgi:hypothetical protein
VANRLHRLVLGALCAASLAAPAAAPERGQRDRQGSHEISPWSAGRCEWRPVEVGLWPPVDLNFLSEKCPRNALALGLPRTRAGELWGVQLALLSAEVERSAYGVQLGGFDTVTGDSAYGLQLAGLANVAGGTFRGARFAGLANVSGDGSFALQLAGLANVSGTEASGVFVAGLASVAGNGASGLFLSGLASVAGEDARGIFVSGVAAVSGGQARGLVFGGLAAVSGEDFAGVQAGGLAAVSGGSSSGLQVGGLASVTGGGFRGLQVGGLASVSESLRGAQVSLGRNELGSGSGLQLALGYNRVRGDLEGAQLAIFNWADEATAQIGLVNLAGHVSGMQLGLVNIADEVAAPIGPVSWVRGGPRNLELWGGDGVPLELGVRLGNARVYSLAALGFRPLSALALGGGAGVHLVEPQPGFVPGVDLDGLVHELLFVDSAGGFGTLFSLRARLTFAAAGRLGLFAGLSANAFVSHSRAAAATTLLGDGATWTRDHARVWPGLFAGVSI